MVSRVQQKKTRGRSRPSAEPRSSRSPARRPLSGNDKRRHTRYEEALPIRLFRGTRGMGKKKKKAAQVAFSAHVESRDLSVGGVFLQSTFFLKKGLQVEVEIDLPDLERTVIAHGRVVRVLDGGDEANQGFAIQFDEMIGDSEIYLRAYLDHGEIVQFVKGNAKRYLPGLARTSYPALMEFIIRWQIHEQGDTDE